MVAAMVAEAKVVEVMAEETRVVGVKEVVGKAATATVVAIGVEATAVGATAAVGMVVGAMVVVATVAAARGAGVEAAARVVGATAVAVTEEAVMVAARVAVASLTKPDMSTRTKGGWVFNGDQSVDTAADSRHLPCRDPRFATFRNCSRWPCTNRN